MRRLRLGVNIDHVATLRQARGGAEPDVIAAARVAERSGATGITVHLREDRRHIQDADVRLLRRRVRTSLNLEMSVAPEIVKIACAIKPDQATLVPERRRELTTEGGLAVAGREPAIGRAVKRLRARGIAVSLFIAPEPKEIRAAARVGADFIELHTGEYANARGARQRRELQRLRAGAALALALGLRVNAGHGLNYENVIPVAVIPGMEELNIGHSIVSRAVFTGLGAAVREMADLLRQAERRRTKTGGN